MDIVRLISATIIANGVAFLLGYAEGVSDPEQKCLEIPGTFGLGTGLTVLVVIVALAYLGTSCSEQFVDGNWALIALAAIIGGCIFSEGRGLLLGRKIGLGKKD